MRPRRSAITAAIACLLAGVLGSAAADARALPRLTLGFSVGADAELASGDLATQLEWVPKAQEEGAKIVRLDVFWNEVAPARPADPANPTSEGYDWTKVDAQVQELAAAGFKVLITVQDTPKWAEGAGMPKSAFAGAWRPNVNAYASFSRALAERYSGSFPNPLDPSTMLPRVKYWQAWDEPNLPEYLAPQWVKSGGKLVAESPLIYRRMQNAFYDSVKSVSSSNYVLMAGTAPYGDSPNANLDARMHPVTFDEDVFCLNAALKKTCDAPTYTDAIDNHPYGIGGPTWQPYYSTDVAIPDDVRLTSALKAAVTAKTVRPGGAKGNWVTEISWDTKPPDPNGVPIAKQARWLEQSLYLLWKQGVSTILWYQLADAPPIPNYADTYQAGVYYLNGTAKPSATAFRFPFVSNRDSRTEVTVWGRSPAAGKLSIERKTGGSWRTIATERVSPYQVFELPLALKGAATLRGVVAGQASLSWSQAK